MAFFLFLKLIFLASITVAQTDPLYHFCENNANYTTNGTYRANLDTILSNLTSKSDINYGFYNLSFGQNPDRAHAVALCKGDVEPDTCRSCVTDSIVATRQRCPNQKEAVAWYDSCMLRYSNETILGKMDTRPSAYMWNMNNVTNVDTFNRALRTLLDGLKREAAGSGPLKKFATSSTNGPDFSNIYGLMQCTPDLTEQQCFNCLDGATTEIPTCCGGKQGGRILRPSCNLRFEIYLFYNETPVIAPSPSPSPSPPPPPPTMLSPSTSPSGKSNTELIVIATVVPTVVLVILAALLCIFLRRDSRNTIHTHEDGAADDISMAESLQYDFGVIRAATGEFSETNKLGEGGFGSVYKGTLPNGQDIAVKRLAMDSGQGDQEFKNEVLLVARLQHRNLVRLIGFSLEGKERLLIYEFVPNASLDHIIFDPTKRATLDWDRRYKVIGGVARGLLYLHEDSRLRIIHRDLKASNVLLDEEMNAKIADFGMARLFSQEESQGSTSRIVGTYGYMAPEYAMHGQFSVKSDVFSFGVLVLEIVTGQKNSCFRNGEVAEDLLSHAWKSWREGTASNIIDPVLRAGSSSLRDMMRCIHIGLLCVQENAADRPTMASVVLMLTSFSVTLPVPSEPAFFMHSSIGPRNSLPENCSSGISDSSQKRSGFGRETSQGYSVEAMHEGGSCQDENRSRSSHMSVATISSVTVLYPR